jgi:hypothetical protein
MPVGLGFAVWEQRLALSILGIFLFCPRALWGHAFSGDNIYSEI